MTSKKIADSIFNIKEKLTDKEFKEIMDKLSIKNKEEDKVELYEFTYMKMRKPTLDKNGHSFIYNFANYKIKTKNVVFKNDDDDDQFKRELLSNDHNWLHTMPFMLSKSKTQNYYILSQGCMSMCSNSVLDMHCENPLADEDDDDDDDNSECDKCIYTALKKKKGEDIRYRKMIGLSIKKK